MIEKKTAASGAIGAVITLVLILNAWQHWFTAPPADAVAGITAALATLVGYFAPHTHLQPVPVAAVQPPATGTGGVK